MSHRPVRPSSTSRRFPGSPRCFPVWALALLLAGLPACGSSSGDGGSFVLRTANLAASPDAPVEVSGSWLVYLASETFQGQLPMGTDLNNDGDTQDDVAVAVNLSSNVSTPLGVACQKAVVVANEIYLVVDEDEDGVDWNGMNGANDCVLLHWSQSAAVVTLVDTLKREPSDEVPLAVGGRLYYSSDVSLGMVDETSLRYLATSAPTLPVPVLNQIGGGDLEAHLLGQRAGLIFCSLDENAAGTSLNGDMDSNDAVVLALLDGTDPLGRLKNVGLALADDSTPLAAVATGSHDWLAAFLVDEASQGDTNLNDQLLFSQPLLPESCLGSPDTDALDQVLHYLDFSDFLSGAALPVNTGLCGTDRVLVLNGYVATISPESDSNCNLNEDGDSTDEVARWVSTSLPVTPERSASRMHALHTSVAGGSRGLSAIGRRLIAVVDESDDSTDIDGNGVNQDLVGWIDPGDSNPQWQFAHQHPTTLSFGTGVFNSNNVSKPYAGTSWMAADSVAGRLPITFLEAVPGVDPLVGPLNTNLDCAFVQKDSDKVDALPVWADFETGPTLDWDGMGYAVDAANAGIVIARDFAFFRVSEVADNRDYNNDGVKDDVVLFRNPLASCAPTAMATSSSIASPAVFTDGDRGAAFLSSESQAGIDFNGDGDQSDLVVRYFRF